MVSEVGNEEGGGQLDHSQKCYIWSLYMIHIFNVQSLKYGSR